jgi:hypothetical protein
VYAPLWITWRKKMITRRTHHTLNLRHCLLFPSSSHVDHPLHCLPVAGADGCPLSASPPLVRGSASPLPPPLLRFFPLPCYCNQFCSLPDAGEWTAPSPDSLPPEARPWYLIIPSRGLQSPNIPRRHWRCGALKLDMVQARRRWPGANGGGGRSADFLSTRSAAASNTRTFEGSTTPASCPAGQAGELECAQMVWRSPINSSLSSPHLRHPNVRFALVEFVQFICLFQIVNKLLSCTINNWSES